MRTPIFTDKNQISFYAYRFMLMFSRDIRLWSHNLDLSTFIYDVFKMSCELDLPDICKTKQDFSKKNNRHKFGENEGQFFFLK